MAIMLSIFALRKDLQNMVHVKRKCKYHFVISGYVKVFLIDADIDNIIQTVNFVRKSPRSYLLHQHIMTGGLSS